MRRTNEGEALAKRAMFATRLPHRCGEDRGRHLEACVGGDQEEWRRGVRIGGVSEPSEEEANLGPIVESGRTARAPGDPRHVQAASDLHRVNVCTHQHSVFAGSPTSIN